MATLKQTLNKKPFNFDKTPTLQSSLAAASPFNFEDEEEPYKPADTAEADDSELDTPDTDVDEKETDEDEDGGGDEDTSPDTEKGGVGALPKSEKERAYELFDKAKNRNEWLELAQLLGKAATQYAAAQSGLQTGRSMAGLNIPGVDYEKRTEGEERMLERRLRDIRQEEASKAKAEALKSSLQSKATTQEKADLYRQQKLDIAKEDAARRQKELDIKNRMADISEKRLALDQKSAAEKNTAGWKQKDYELKQEYLNIAKEKEAREAAKPQLTPEEKIRIEEESKLRVGEEFATRARDKAIDALIASQAVVISPDSTPLQKEQAKKDLLDSAKKAGIDISDVYSRAQVPGKMWGTNLDESKIIPILKSMKSSASTPARQAPAPSGKIESAPASSAPKPGDVVDGYRFKGGDPAVPTNWEKV